MLKIINPPNLEHLKSFYNVCTAGSIAAAVNETGIPRATLGRHITSIETDLSSVLFIRGARGFALINIGNTVLKYAENIFDCEINTKDMPGHPNTL